MNPDLQLWAIMRGGDVIVMAWACAAHAPEADDSIYALLGLKAVHVTSRAWLRRLRGGSCVDCTLEAGRRLRAVDAGAIGDIQAADITERGGDA